VIDARMVSDQSFGIDRYVCNLVKNLAEIDIENKYTILVQNDILHRSISNANFELKYTQIKWLSPQEQVRLPLLLKKIRPDVFHAPSFVAPWFPVCKTILTIHDLIHLLFPEHYGLKQRIYYKFFIKRLISSAFKVITDSISTRNDLVAHYGIDQAKIKVIYLAADSIFRPLPEVDRIDRFKKTNGLPEKFILYVGNRKKHKNVRTLFEAFRIFKKNDQAGYSLVISGTKDESTIKQAKDLGIEDWLVYAGDVKDEALPLLYNAACLFVFPSLYEGFGFPPLEAMACGIPVIASNASSLPEVVGEAGITINPCDVNALSRAISKVLASKELQKNMRQMALDRAKMFSWAKCAKETLAVYKQIEGQ
ncbi:glycosyltransferase family 4 protein, partial [bacterium]|nr:glycosyltransferase family 4 protein [bacterium]